ncbi:MAG: SRPBCC domain-containing protein [Myxococcales bacterium]|nr:SRPBCC domain-containing protein [Myxococcales bacterium]
MAARSAPGKRLAWSAAGLMSLFVIVTCLLFVWRGTSATSEPKNPTRSADGIRCQLFLETDGGKPVRCAAVLDQKPEAVWAVVTDYSRFGEIFDSKLWRVVLASHDQDPDGRFHLVGRVVAPYAEYPFDVFIRHEMAADRSVASWDETDGEGSRTRGSWTLTPLEGGRTLLVYQQEIRARRAPPLIVNNLLLAQLGGAVKRVKARVTP